MVGRFHYLINSLLLITIYQPNHIPNGYQFVEFERDSLVVISFYLYAIFWLLIDLGHLSLSSHSTAHSFFHVHRSENQAIDSLATRILQDDNFVYNLVIQSSFVWDCIPPIQFLLHFWPRKKKRYLHTWESNLTSETHMPGLPIENSIVNIQFSIGKVIERAW